MKAARTPTGLCPSPEGHREVDEKQRDIGINQ